jgi:ribosome maturation factor RimP
MDLERIKSIILPVVASYGVEVTSLSFRYLRSGALLRVLVDRKITAPVPVPYPGSPVDLSLLEKLSREISAVVEASLSGGSKWSLEISSPGLDRRISDAEEYRFFVNHPMRVTLRAPLMGRRNFSGKLVAVDEVEGAVEAISIETDQGVERLSVADIEASRLVPLFPEPSAGRSKKKKKKK